ncbi:MAG: hypothetical protein ACO1PN_04805 [Betaproteobacteria bacterium]
MTISFRWFGLQGVTAFSHTLPEQALFEKKPFGIGLPVLHNDTSALLVDDDLRHQRRLQGHALPRFELCLRHTLRLVAIHIVFAAACFMPFERSAPGTGQQQDCKGDMASMLNEHIRLDYQNNTKLPCGASCAAI